MASEGEVVSDSDDANVTKVSTRHLDFLKSRIMHYLCSKQDVSAEIYHNEGQPAQMILRFGTNQGLLSESSIQTSNRLLVKNLPQAADEDYLQMFFEYEKGQGGGLVERVTLNKEERFAIVEFKQAEAVSEVMNKKPIKMLNGALVDVEVYSPYLDDNEKLKSIELIDIPDELIKEIAEVNLKEFTGIIQARTFKLGILMANGFLYCGIEIPANCFLLPFIGPLTCVFKQTQDNLAEYDWYHGDLDRQGAEAKLHANGQDETFLIRNSQEPSLPYTISLFYNGLPHHVHIRKRPDGTFEAGGEGLEVFSDVPALVTFYKQNEFALLDQKVEKSYTICLGDTVK